MHNNLLLSTKTTRVSNAVAAGTTAINTTVLDMEGYDSVIWTALFGALTATQVTGVKVQAGNASDGSDFADLVGAVSTALADADGNKGLMIEVQRNAYYRYYRLVVTRGTANAVVDGVLAMQYSSRKQPTSQDTTIKDALLSVSPQVSNAAFAQTTTTYGGSTTRISNTARTSS